MKNLKKYIFGISAALILALTISNVTFAHGENSYSTRSWGNSMMGGIGMMSGLMWDSDMNDEDWDDMRKMHDLMWKDGNLTQEEFEWIIDEQEEYMGWSWIENRFKNVDEYNQQGGQMGFGRGMSMMGGYSMWR